MKKIAIALTFVFCAAVPASAQFGKNKIVYDRFDWKIYRSTHFSVYFYESERPALPKVTSYAESAYDDISRALNFQIPKAINLIYQQQVDPDKAMTDAAAAIRVGTIS